MFWDDSPATVEEYLGKYQILTGKHFQEGDVIKADRLDEYYRNAKLTGLLIETACILNETSGQFDVPTSNNSVDNSTKSPSQYKNVANPGTSKEDTSKSNPKDSEQSKKQKRKSIEKAKVKPKVKNVSKIFNFHFTYIYNPNMR